MNKLKMLIIEDSKTFNNMLKRLFKNLADEIIQAFSFMEAEEYLENKEFDFIILDLILPDGEGEDLIEFLPKDLRAKTIVLSGDDDVERRNHLFKMGILDYFSKLNPMGLILEDIKKLIISIEKNKNINLLVIDDSRFMRRNIKNLLYPRKYNLFMAESAEEGLAILKEEDIHLVLLDVELPGISGINFIEIMKKNQKFIDIPVIALSSNDSPHIVARLLKHGANDFIKKPYIPEQLILKCDLHVRNYLNVLLLAKRTEQLKQAEKAKSIFLANMSHEIRTPLNAIVGFVDILKEKNLDEESKKYINIISNSSKMLLNILNDILDLSKIEAGKLTIEKVVFNLEEEILVVLDLLRLKAIEKHINLKEEFINLPKYVRSDPTRLKQVIMNLLSNAIKFTPENKNIYAKFEYKDNKLFVSIKDEGIGMSPDQAKKIFEPFKQADDSTTRKYGGTGLGVTISKNIVELLGGELKLKTELNKGSEFYFEIPIEVVDNYKEEKIEIKKEFNSKVLVVEDNKANQMFLEVVLKKLNLEYEIANNGKEAIEKYKDGKFDIILMDENMPIMNGIEAVKHIRKYEEENNLKHTPIISVTANALQGDRERFLNAGFDDYLAKPIDLNKLKEILSKFL